MNIDPELQAIPGNVTVSVLIALDLPCPQVKLRKNETSFSPMEIVPLTEQERQQEQERKEVASLFLEVLTNNPPRWIEAAKVFAVELNGQQLEVVKRFPTVKSIMVNKTRKVL